MGNPNFPPAPAEVSGHERAIAAMGAIALGIEQGPNKRTPETSPELAPEAEPILSDDAVKHIASTLIR